MRTINLLFKACKKTILLLIVVSFFGSVHAQTQMKTFHFGHSLVQHDNEYSNLFHWFNELSVEAGNTYSLEGQFGFLSGQQTPIANLNMGSTLYNSTCWNTDFATSDFDNTVITAAYYAHYEFECWENAYGVVRLDELHRLVDYVRGETPDIKVYLYATWTEPGEPSLMSAGDFEYFKNDSRALHDWWIRTQDTLNGSRPNLDAKIIPVGQVLADVLDNVSGMEVLTPTDLFVDDAGHGTPTFYFMAALVHYMTQWGEQCPSTYTVPSNIHLAVRNNYATIVSYIWNELQTFNYPDGSSRVFFSADETAPSVPEGLNVGTISATTANISWNPSSDDNSVSSYRVYVNGATPIMVTDTSTIITGLSPNTTYDITVSAGDRAGNWSEQTTALRLTTLDVTTYTLVVNNGSGNGDWAEGDQISIQADPPTSGFIFDGWTGDITNLSSTTSASTTLLMPASSVTISANYATIQTGDTIHIEAENYSAMNGISTASTSDIGGGQKVTGIESNDYVEYTINFSTAGTYFTEYRVSGEGSVGDMDVIINSAILQHLDLQPTGGLEVFSTIQGNNLVIPSAGTYTLRLLSYGTNWNINWINFILRTTYTLTVNNGTGTGVYEINDNIDISANTAPFGQQFNQWTGDTQYLSNPNVANTSLSMPGSDVNVTATYSTLSSGLWVVYEDTDQGWNASYRINDTDPNLSNGTGFRLWDQSIASFTFTGTQIRVYSMTSDWFGAGTVSIDGGTPVVYDCYSETDQYQILIFESSYLTNGQHTLTITGGTGTNIAIDYIEVYVPESYQLTVTNGTGGGTYTENSIINISATPAAEGQEFLSWSGDISYLEDSNSPTTTVTMPAGAVNITATYQLITNNIALEDKIGVMIYPNPTREVLHIKNTKEFSRIEISSISGEIIDEMVISPDVIDVVVDVSHLDAGVYLFGLYNNSSKYMERFIKKD